MLSSNIENSNNDENVDKLPELLKRKSRSLNTVDLRLSVNRGSEPNLIVFNEVILVEINKLLKQFPDPPTESIQVPAIPKSNAQSQNQKTLNGWGTFRGLAEKFNMFK